MSKRRAYLEPAALEALLDDACKKIVQHLRTTREGAAILLGRQNEFPLVEFVDSVLDGLTDGGENVPFESLQEYAQKNADWATDAKDRRFYAVIEKTCAEVRTQVKSIKPKHLRRTRGIVPIDSGLLLKPT